MKKSYCARCGCVRPLAEKKHIEDFVVKGTFFVCALCGNKIEDVSAVDKSECKGTEEISDLFCESSSDKAKQENIFSEEVKDVHFCRDCSHYLRHPFQSRCCLHDKPVSPTYDCEEFSKLSHNHDKS